MGALIALLGIVGAAWFAKRELDKRRAGVPPALPPAGGGTSPGQPPLGPTIPGPVIPTAPGVSPPAGAFPSPCLDSTPELAEQFREFMTDVTVPPATLDMAANYMDQLGCSGEAMMLRAEAQRRRAAAGGGGLPFPIPGGLPGGGFPGFPGFPSGGGTPPFVPGTSGEFPAPPPSVAGIASWMESLRNAA